MTVGFPAIAVKSAKFTEAEGGATADYAGAVEVELVGADAGFQEAITD
jgi:hypothetical protein